MRRILQFKSIKAKMLFGFSIVLLLVIVLGVYNFFSISNVNNDIEEVVDDEVPIMNAASKITFNTADSVANVRGYILYGDSKYKEQFNENEKGSEENRETLAALMGEEAVKQLHDKIDQWWEMIHTDVIDPYDQGNVDIAKENLTEKVEPLTEEILNALDERTEARGVSIKENGDRIVASGKTTILVGTIVSILVVVLGIAAAVITSSLITKPIKTVMHRMTFIASGDLSDEPLETKAKDEIGQLVGATNDMNESMRTLLGQINNVSETVNSQSEELTQAASEVMNGSEQIASTMQELASGTEAEANHVSALSSTMGAFAAKVEEANENGQHVQQTSNDVLEMTNEGYQLMEQSTQQMNVVDHIVKEAVEKVQHLDMNARKISELVSVIQGIADQTNLLALNAAIEASRAGEHGKGFAVVADEVRKLAEGVSVSVTDITGIVTSIQEESSHVTASLQHGYKEVEQGTNQITTTGETFREISTAVEKMVYHIQTVTGNLSEITGESEQMNSAIQEMSAISEESAAGIEQTSASSQQSSSSMEEITASSTDLARLAEELNGLVRQFKL